MNDAWLNYTVIIIGLLVFGIPVIWTIISFGFKAGRDVIGLSETKLAMFAAMVLSFVIILLNLGVATRIIVRFFREQNFLLLFLGVPSVFLLLVALFAYLCINLRFGAMIGLLPTTMLSESTSRLKSIVAVLVKMKS